MALESRPLLIQARHYFCKVISEHEKVVSVKCVKEEFYKAIYEIQLIDGRNLVTYIADVYTLTAADIREIVTEYEMVDCIVVVSNWDHYTSEAKNVAKRMGIGVYTLVEFMKAINYNGKKFLDIGITKPSKR